MSVGAPIFLFEQCAAMDGTVKIGQASKSWRVLDRRPHTRQTSVQNENCCKFYKRSVAGAAPCEHMHKGEVE